MAKKKRDKRVPLNLELPVPLIRLFDEIARDAECTSQQVALVLLLLQIKRLKIKDVK